MLTLENVTKTYRSPRGRKTILDRANLSIPIPKNIGVLGRNGAGKSTLLRVISGSVGVDRGEIHRTGDFSWPLGFAGSFHGALTGQQNVDFIASIYGRDNKMLREYVLEFSELKDAFYEPFRTYSSGMRARLAFGVSMGVEFDVYLIDELTAVGDVNFKKKCKVVFEEKLQSSKVVMVSHAESTIREYCEIGAVLEDGVLTLFDDLEESIKFHNENMARK